MRRFASWPLFLVLILSIAAAPAFAQSIFVSNDEWFTSPTGLPLVDDTQLTLNVAAWLTANAPGKNILILSDNPGLNNASLQTVLSGAGYTVTQTTVVPTTFLKPDGSPRYDAVFVSGDCHLDPLVFGTALCSAGFAALNTTLIAYVASGGNVMLEVGLVCNAGSETWNTFLNAFDLSIVHGCNGILASDVNVSSFQNQPPYGSQLFAGVNAVYIDNGENVFSLSSNCGHQVFQDANGNGLYGAWRPCCTGARRKVTQDSTLRRAQNLAPNGGNLIANGSFETGDFTGWTMTGACPQDMVVEGLFYEYQDGFNGPWYAVFGPVGGYGSLRQSVATAPGTSYAVTYWFSAVGDMPSGLIVFWDNNVLYNNMNDPNTGASWTGPNAATVVGTGSDTLMFVYRDDPGWIALDDVAVQ
jgi:hypothetical protein